MSNGSTGKELRGLLNAKHPDGLEAVRSQLADGSGLRAASADLDVSVSQLRRYAADWPALARVVRDGAMDPTLRASLAGQQFAANLAERARKRRKGTK
jgi:hypothetical protein